MIQFREIETFYWVLAIGSFSAAARKLNTTQPAVSQRIAALEATLGTRLLTRKSRQVVATPAGRELLVYAEKLLSIRSEMMARFADRSTVRGVLRLGVAETIVHTWLPEFIKAVSARYPRLSIEIEVDISPSLRQRLLAQEIDLAFLIGPLTVSTVRNLPLATYRLAFLASPTLELGRNVGLADLARHPLLTFSRRTQPYEVLRSLFQGADLPPLNFNASASLSTIVHLAVEGLGIAVIPPAIVARELAAGELVEIGTKVTLPDLGFTASWLASPDANALETVAGLAGAIARGQAGEIIGGPVRAGRVRATPAARAPAPSRTSTSSKSSAKTSLPAMSGRSPPRGSKALAVTQSRRSRRRQD